MGHWSTRYATIELCHPDAWRLWRQNHSGLYQQLVGGISGSTLRVFGGRFECGYVDLPVKALVSIDGIEFPHSNVP